jgi:hypothetical protein
MKDLFLKDQPINTYNSLRNFINVLRYLSKTSGTFLENLIGIFGSSQFLLEFP